MEVDSMFFKIFVEALICQISVVPLNTTQAEWRQSSEAATVGFQSVWSVYGDKTPLILTVLRCDMHLEDLKC